MRYEDFAALAARQYKIRLRGASPPGLTRSLAGPQRPTPLAWAHSQRSFATRLFLSFETGSRLERRQRDRFCRRDYSVRNAITGSVPAARRAGR